MNVKIVDVIVLYCTVRPIFEEGKIKLCKLKKKKEGNLVAFGYFRLGSNISFILRCICRYLLGRSLLGHLPSCFKFLGVSLMKLKAQMMPLEKNSHFFSDVTLCQRIFWVGRTWGLGSVYMILSVMYKQVYWKENLSTLCTACNLNLETKNDA